MKTIITLKDGSTTLELVPENQFEQNFINDFDIEQNYRLLKESKTSAYYDQSKKLTIRFYGKTEQQ